MRALCRAQCDHTGVAEVAPEACDPCSHRVCYSASTCIETELGKSRREGVPCKLLACSVKDTLAWRR